MPARKIELPVGGRPGEAHHDRRHRDDAVVRAEDRGAQPVEQAVQRVRVRLVGVLAHLGEVPVASVGGGEDMAPSSPSGSRPATKDRLRSSGRASISSTHAGTVSVAGPWRTSAKSLTASGCQVELERCPRPRRSRSARTRPPGRRARRCRSRRTGRTRRAPAARRPCRRGPRRTRPRRAAASPRRSVGQGGRSTRAPVHSWRWSQVVHQAARSRPCMWCTRSGAAALVQVVDVLGHQVEVVAEVLLEPGQRDVGRRWAAPGPALRGARRRTAAPGRGRPRTPRAWRPPSGRGPPRARRRRGRWAARSPPRCRHR